mmetsp:Transcript_7163/g.24624  ORF Transcript_7163/g.24624 Transcript_7163/m.24624 type:complete len:266 (+) Transcript_7163:505-1302(+)
MCSTHAMPSSSALCASMGPGMTSPMAWMEGTLVWNLSLTKTRPRSISIPRSSRPRPSVKGLLPIATRTTSASMCSCSPPSAGSTVSLTPSASATALVTLDLSLILIPCFFMTRSKFLRTSWSIAGTIFGKNSMTSTSAPSLDHTDPSSSPMMPPPMTTIFLGTSLSAMAPVDDTILSSSIWTPGSGVTSLPVASTTFLATTFSSPPSEVATVTSFAPVTLPHPLTYLTLFFLNRPSIPLVKPPTACSFWAIILPTSIATLSTWIP